MAKINKATKPIKNTTSILIPMVQEEREYSLTELANLSALSYEQIKIASNFLRRGGILKVRYEKTQKKPFRKALFSLNPKKYAIILRLLKEEGIEVVF